MIKVLCSVLTYVVAGFVVDLVLPSQAKALDPRLESVLSQALKESDNAKLIQQLEMIDYKDVRAATAILEGLYPKLADPALPAQRQIQRGLSVVQDLIRGKNLTVNDGKELRLRLHFFLLQYAEDGLSQRAVIDLYRSFNLWSGEELWFLKAKAASLQGAMEFFEDLRIAAKNMNPHETQSLNDSLNLVRPFALAPLLIQYELGAFAEYQYEILLLMLEDLYRPRASESYRPTSFNGRLVALPVLEDLQRRYRARVPLVLDAIHDLRERAVARSESRAFYEMFDRNEFRAMKYRFPELANPEAKDPLGLGSRTMLFLPAPTTEHKALLGREGNVLSVQFGAKSCNLVHHN